MAFNIIDSIGTYQFHLQHDYSAFNKSLVGVYGTGEEGSYQLTPGEAADFQFTFGDFMRGAGAVVSVFLRSTVYLPYIIQDIGFPLSIGLVIAIPYNLIIIYGLAQFISNRMGRGR